MDYTECSNKNTTNNNNNDSKKNNKGILSSPGGLQSMGSQRLGHHWAIKHITYNFISLNCTVLSGGQIIWKTQTTKAPSRRNITWMALYLLEKPNQ